METTTTGVSVTDGHAQTDRQTDTHTHTHTHSVLSGDNAVILNAAGTELKLRYVTLTTLCGTLPSEAHASERRRLHDDDLVRATRRLEHLRQTVLRYL